jgi:hypothetical protein
MEFPSEHWRQISSTNPLERLNKEINRRTRVAGIFPDEKSLIRLIEAVSCKQNDEWMVGRRCMSRHYLARVYQTATPEIEGEVTHAFPIPAHRKLSGEDPTSSRARPGVSQKLHGHQIHAPRAQRVPVAPGLSMTRET